MIREISLLNLRLDASMARNVMKALAPHYVFEDAAQPRGRKSWNVRRNGERMWLAGAFGSKAEAAAAALTDHAVHSAEALRSARELLAAATADARQVAGWLIEAGASEVAAADALGVDRLTLRKWIGKGR